MALSVKSNHSSDHVSCYLDKTFKTKIKHPTVVKLYIFRTFTLNLKD